MPRVGEPIRIMSAEFLGKKIEHLCIQDLTGCDRERALTDLAGLTPAQNLKLKAKLTELMNSSYFELKEMTADSDIANDAIKNLKAACSKGHAADRQSGG